MATRGEGSRGVQRTLRDLLPIAAAAAAAALGVTVVMTPAASFLGRSFSGLASEIPASVSAPVARPSSPGDITVRVRPGRPAPVIALVDPAVSPVELVTGRPATARGRGGPGGRAAGAGAAGPVALALPAPDAAAPSVPADVEAPPAPLLAAPSLEAVPEKLDDSVSATKQRKRPSRPLRDTTSATAFSVTGTKTTSDSKASQPDRSDAGAMSLASLSLDPDPGKTKGNDKGNDKFHDKAHDNDHPGQGQDDEAKKRNPKPEMK